MLIMKYEISAAGHSDEWCTLHTHTSDTQLFALSQLQMVKAKYDANKLTRKKKSDQFGMSIQNGYLQQLGLLEK